MRRAVFLDRDGVINFNAPDFGYVRSWDEWRWIPGIVDWIRIFNALRLPVLIVTNQRGVGRGLMTAADLDRVHAIMRAELAGQGAHIDDIFVCPHDKDQCECRKPKPGLVLEAAAKWNIDLPHSLYIGDSDKDEELARLFAIPFLRVFEGRVVSPVAPFSGISVADWK